MTKDTNYISHDKYYNRLVFVILCIHFIQYTAYRYMLTTGTKKNLQFGDLSILAKRFLKK